MIELLCLAAALAFAIGCDIYDVTETVKGIAKGVAVEANTFWLGTDKPTAKQLYLRDGLVIALATLPAVLLLVLLYGSPAFYIALVGPAIAGAKHLQGGLQWRKLGIK
jgi:hypothetical protein